MRFGFDARPWTFGATDTERFRQREAMFVWVRWFFALFSVFAAWSDEGRWASVAWSIPAFVGAVNVVASIMCTRLGRIGSLRALAVGVTLADGFAVTASMFNYAENLDTATGLLLMLVVLEAAIRFELPGGAVAGALAGLVTIVWMTYREDEYGVPLESSPAGARVGAYVVGALLLGALVGQIDRAGRQARAQIARTEAVGRFAIDAPRLSVEEAARRMADILHRDLDFEFAAVVMTHDGDPSTFRLVAIAGYEPEVVDRFARFPVSTGIVGRCFRTAEPQLVADVTEDPDYLDVDSRIRSEMTVPLRARGEVFGAFDVASSRPRAFDEEDMWFLESAAAQLAVAFDNARLAEMERRTIEELEELSAMKDDFIAIANHELRTPVTTVAGFAQSLLKQRDVLSEEEIQDAIERIARQSAHLKSLIEDVLTLPGGQRPESLEPEVVWLPGVVEEVVRELDPHDGIHDLRVEISGTIPELRTDRSALVRVLTNLVANAIKYSPDGRAVVVRSACRDGSVEVEVEDEGVGIGPEHLPMLFTKFGKASHREDGSGMGLGLFIVKELVEDMGGTVGVDSERGRGSRFWFRLPAQGSHLAK